MLIGDLIRRRAAASPEQEFWRDKDLSISYDQVNRDANRVARALLAEDLQPGDHIAICSASCYEYTAVHFGVAKAGMVLAHLNPKFSPSELQHVAEHSEAKLMFIGSSVAHRTEPLYDKLSKIIRWVGLPDGGTEACDWLEPIGHWVEDHGDDEPDLSPFANPPDTPVIFPESPLQLLYTSGTTGFPKGALISHQAKIRHGTTHVLNMRLGLGDRLYSALPLYHQFAQWLVLTSVPLAGASVLAVPKFDPAHCWQSLLQGGITHMGAVPTMLYRLLEHQETLVEPAPDLRGIVYGGAPMDAQRIQSLRVSFPGAELFQGFGQTEVGYCIGLHDPEHQTHPESVGKADLFSEIMLVDEDGKLVPDGAVGEIVAATPYLMNGYYKDPIATSEFFAFGPEWGRTGDLALKDEDGFYHLAGRKVDLVISGGVNIYPIEIERALEKHPAVADVAVFGIPHPDWGETIHAVIVLNPNSQATEEQLAEFCRDELAGFKVPKSFSFTDALPRTHSGKVRKIDLKAPYWESFG